MIKKTGSNAMKDWILDYDTFDMFVYREFVRLKDDLICTLIDNDPQINTKDENHLKSEGQGNEEDEEYGEMKVVEKSQNQSLIFFQNKGNESEILEQ